VNFVKPDQFIVGGAVRDRLLGRPVTDLDIVCRHAKKAAKAAAKEHDGTLVVLDDQNKIYRVVLRDSAEIKTLDFAEMQGGSIEKDLARRDFTVNAMAIRNVGSGEWGVGSTPHTLRPTPYDVIDPFGGQRDLKRGILRAVSRKAFPDDPLRVVRAFRFMSQLGFTIETQTLKWVKGARLQLRRVAGERVRHELLTLFEQPLTAPTLRLMDKIGLLTQIFPDLEASRRTALRYYGKGGVLKHAFETVEALEWLLSPTPKLPYSLTPYLTQSIGGHPRVALLKLAALLHDVGKPATAKVIKGRLRFFEHEHVGAEQAYRGLAGLRFSRQECLLGRSWVKNHMRLGSLAAAGNITDKAIARYFRDLGDEGIGMILLSLGDHFTYLKRSLWGKGKDPVEKTAWRMLGAYLNEKSKVLPERLVNGHELMKALKLKPGPLIGKLLTLIQDAQVDGLVKTKADALSFAQKQPKKL